MKAFREWVQGGGIIGGLEYSGSIFWMMAAGGVISMVRDAGMITSQLWGSAESGYLLFPLQSQSFATKNGVAGVYVATLPPAESSRAEDARSAAADCYEANLARAYNSQAEIKKHAAAVGSLLEDPPILGDYLDEKLGLEEFAAVLRDVRERAFPDFLPPGWREDFLSPSGTAALAVRGWL